MPHCKRQCRWKRTYLFCCCIGALYYVAPPVTGRLSHNAVGNKSDALWPSRPVEVWVLQQIWVFLRWPLYRTEGGTVIRQFQRCNFLFIFIALQNLFKLAFWRLKLICSSFCLLCCIETNGLNDIANTHYRLLSVWRNPFRSLNETYFQEPVSWGPFIHSFLLGNGLAIGLRHCYTLPPHEGRQHRFTIYNFGILNHVWSFLTAHNGVTRGNVCRALSRGH